MSGKDSNVKFCSHLVRIVLCVIISFIFVFFSDIKTNFQLSFVCVFYSVFHIKSCNDGGMMEKNDQ